jgi:diguanylate cyclase (GGDEF)-like protein
MKQAIYRRSIFIGLYVIMFIFWLLISRHNEQIVDIGINIFTAVAYIFTIFWMTLISQNEKDKQRYFWFFLTIGTCFLFISKLISLFYPIFDEKIINSLLEDSIHLIGYLFFFTGLTYKIKMIKNTLAMLQFLLNIIVIITAVFSVSWYFIVSPILTWNQEITKIGFLISSIYHVLNISLLLATICLIFISKGNHRRTSLYLIAVGFLLQSIGDFFIINHIEHFGDWMLVFGPLSTIFLGLSASFSNKDQLDQDKKTEQLEYKNFHLSLISASILLVFTLFNQLYETNILQKGLHLSILILLLQLIITTFENKNIFIKLKLLASSDGDIRQTKDVDKQNSEISRLLGNIEKLAHYDELTQLPNRNFFQKSMEYVLKTAKEKDSKFSLMYIDLDRFKYVNDTLGHDCGDLLLQHVANRLIASVDQKSTVARIGGDEFAIILMEYRNSQLGKIASGILSQFEQEFTINGHDLYITPSIGISVFPESGRTTCDLLKSADAAMYLAKEEGKNKFEFFNPSLNEMLSKKVQIESRLRRGIEEDNFSLYFQPQVDLMTEKIVGIEALIRWNDPQLGMVSPIDFIPVAEETGLIEPIGMWVIKTACLQLREWKNLGYGDVPISVNVSIRQFQNPTFVSEVKKVLAVTKLAPKYLKIEITESVLQNIDKTIKVLNALREIGIQIAIDDFGTGYSSLSYLKNLPVNCLKIDKSFIEELSDNKNGPIVKTIIDMGRNMDFSVIAEGVESMEQVVFLRKNHCYVGQGYLFSKPLPAKEIERFFQKNSLRISELQKNLFKK